MGCFKKTRCLIEWNLNDNDDAKKQFEIVGSCGHELLLPGNCCSFWIGRILKVFPLVLKISMNVPSMGSRINRLGCFFLNTHITNIYRYHNHIHRNIKLMLALESCVFHSFWSHVVPMETMNLHLGVVPKLLLQSSSCFVTVTILNFVDAHDFYGWFVLEWRWCVQDALL